MTYYAVTGRVDSCDDETHIVQATTRQGAAAMFRQAVREAAEDPLPPDGEIYITSMVHSESPIVVDWGAA